MKSLPTLPSRSLLVLLSALVLTSCTPRIRLEWSRPARFEMPASKRVALDTDLEGVRPTASNVLDAVVGASQGQLLNKWVAIEPLRGELADALRQAGYQVVPKAQADLLLRVKPTAWTFQPGDKQAGRPSGQGRLEADVEAFDPKKPREPALFSSGYYANASASNVGELESMAKAAKNLALRFMEDTRPSRVSQSVELDDSDPITKPGVELCKKGRFEGAHEAFSHAVERSPRSAPALYDLAVLTAARGNYDQAEELLLRAAQLEPKPMYYEALERVRNARADQKSTSGN